MRVKHKCYEETVSYFTIWEQISLNYEIHDKNDLHLLFCCYLFFIDVVVYTIPTASLKKR